MGRARIWIRHLLLPALGLLLLVGTLIYGVVLGSFPGWLVGMGLCAVALVVLGVLWQERGSFRDSAASMIYSFFVLLCAVFIYLIASNHSRRLDLTRYQVNTLSEQTVSLLRGLEGHIRVVAFSAPRERPEYESFFDLYEQYTDHVSFEIYDPNADVGIARQFDENVFPGYVYAISTTESGEERRHRIRLSPNEERRENKLSNALLRAQRGGAEKIYFTKGHNERALAANEKMSGEAALQSLGYLVQIIEQNVMPVEEIGLMTENRVPADAALVIVAGPTADLLEFEREILVEYLNEGGALMVMIEPEFGQGELDDLAGLVQLAGVSTPNNIVIDQMAPQFLDAVTAPVPEHAIMRDIPNSLVVTRQSRALTISPDLAEAQGISVSPLLVTNASAWTRNPREIFSRRDLAPPEDPELIHSQVLATASSFPTAGGVRGSVARVVVFGDADFLSDALIPQGANAYVALNAVNWLVAREDMLAIPPKLIPKTSFQLPVNRLYVVLGVLLLLDLGMLAGGVGYTMARRRLG